METGQIAGDRGMWLRVEDVEAPLRAARSVWPLPPCRSRAHAQAAYRILYGYRDPRIPSHADLLLRGPPKTTSKTRTVRCEKTRSRVGAEVARQAGQVAVK